MIHRLIPEDWDLWLFGDALASAPIRRHVVKGYDPQKYDLKPKKEYIDKLLKDKDELIAYHEECIVRLRKEKEDLQKQE